MAETDLPLERVRKWCPDPAHRGPREYEGWAFAGSAPLAALSRVQVDEDGRTVHRCDACIDRREAAQHESQRPKEERTEDFDLRQPERAREWWDDD